MAARSLQSKSWHVPTLALQQQQQQQQQQQKLRVLTVPPRNGILMGPNLFGEFISHFWGDVFSIFLIGHAINRAPNLNWLLYSLSSVDPLSRPSKNKNQSHDKLLACLILASLTSYVTSYANLPLHPMSHIYIFFALANDILLRAYDHPPSNKKRTKESWSIIPPAHKVVFFTQGTSTTQFSRLGRVCANIILSCCMSSPKNTW